MDHSVLVEALRRTDTITFDCYGTLIDWRRGLAETFRRMYGPPAEDRMSELLDAYGQVEADVEAEAFHSYARVLDLVAKRLADRFDLELPPERAGLLPELLPGWIPFSDTVAALARLKKRYRLGILSNVDRDLFAGTARSLGVSFDFVITAEDVRAYKPNPAHFERMLDSQPDHSQVLHVAQSLFHDGIPATRLGLRYVWINRYNDVNETPVKPLATLPDLKSLADAADASGE